MSYSLSYFPSVYSYLRSERCGLSREGRIKLFLSLDLHLREFGDDFRQDAGLRVRLGSPYFLFDPIIRDPVTEQLHYFRFYVDDSAAEMGVLQVVYAEKIEQG